MWTYDFFPFDYQTIRFRVSLPFADIRSSCRKWATDLTSADEWTRVPAWAFHHDPPVQTTVETADMCLVEIKVYRLTLKYMITTLTALIVIIYGALLTLRVDPTVPPLFGGRVGALMSAMLTVMLKADPAEQHLGPLTYLIWNDIFSLCQFVILVAALVLSITIHFLHRFGQKDRAKDMDKVVRTAIPFVVYPGMVLAMVVAGLVQAYWVGGVIFLVCLMIGVVIPSLGTLARRRAISKHKRQVIQKLHNLDGKLTTPEAYETIMAAFDTFDEDHSGGISKKEMASMVKIMYPHLRGAELGEAVLKVHTDEVSKDMFMAVLADLNTHVQDTKKAPTKSRRKSNAEKGSFAEGEGLVGSPGAGKDTGNVTWRQASCLQTVRSKLSKKQSAEPQDVFADVARLSSSSTSPQQPPLQSAQQQPDVASCPPSPPSSSPLPHPMDVASSLDVASRM